MTSRRRRRSAAPLLAVLAVALVAAGVWLWTNPPQDAEDLGAEPLTPVTAAAAGVGLSPRPAGPTPAVPVLAAAAPTSGGGPAPAPAAPVAAATTRSEPPQPVFTQPSPPDPLAAGRSLIERGMVVQGRAALSQFLTEQPSRLSEADLQAVRDVLTDLNERLVFSPNVLPDDPLVEAYVVQTGDLLARLAPRYKVPYQALVRVNKVEPSRIRVGQKLKMVRGPFHVVVDKSDYRLDLYLHDMTGQPIFIRSFAVGLGEDNSTPVGKWRVEPGRKVANPDWKNPRTGEYFPRDDPRIPIGEHWIALEGTDDNTRGKTGYGIHGTTQADSIGAQMSMGCIRMRDEDVALLFDLLFEGDSTVKVQP